MNLVLKRILPLFLCLFLLTACGDTLEGLKKQAETEHFIFYSEKEDADSIAMVSTHLEEKYDEFTSRLSFTPAGKTSVLIFPDRETFIEGLRNQGLPEGAEFPLSHAGMGFPSNDIYIPSSHTLSLSQEELLSAYTHEFVHILVYALNEAVPFYLLEGVSSYLAEQKEYLNVEQVLSDSLLSETFPSVKELELMNAYHGNLYPYAYSYVEYVIETYGFDQLLEIIKETKYSPYDTAEDLTYAVVFGVNEQSFQEGWMKFVEEKYIHSEQ